MANQSWSSSRWIRIRCGDAAVAFLVFAIAATGFYVSWVPLFVGAAGLAAVTLTRNRCRRFSVALGWHAAAFLPIWAGFLNLQVDFSVPTGILLAFPAIVALAFALLNAGFAVALGLMFPWYVGSPALVAGDLWPGTGVIGILLVPLLLAGLDARSRKVRTATVALASIASICCWLIHEPFEARGFSEVKISPLPAMTTASRERRLLDMLPDASVVFLGENVINRSNAFSVDRWCRYAATHRTEIYIGAIEKDGRSAIYRINNDGRCDPESVHERLVALPAVTGSPTFGWEIGAGSRKIVSVGPNRVRWFICFAVFSPMAWVFNGIEQYDVIVVAGNDYWTQPVTVETARRKAAQSMARLWGVSTIATEANSLVGNFSPEPAFQNGPLQLQEQSS